MASIIILLALLCFNILFCGLCIHTKRQLNEARLRIILLEYTLEQYDQY